MITLQAQPITGREHPIDPRDPEGALAEFYRAYNNRDLALMEQNWDGSDEASMDNPLGGIRRGWSDIRKFYERMFRSKPRVNVEFHSYSLQRFGDVLLAVGRERGTARTDYTHLELEIRTSRLFVQRDGRWRQIHQHGSIDDPGLLARYQGLLRITPSGET